MERESELKEKMPRPRALFLKRTMLYRRRRLKQNRKGEGGVESSFVSSLLSLSPFLPSTCEIIEMRRTLAAAGLSRIRVLFSQHSKKKTKLHVIIMGGGDGK